MSAWSGLNHCAYFWHLTKNPFKNQTCKNAHSLKVLNIIRLGYHDVVIYCDLYAVVYSKSNTVILNEHCVLPNNWYSHRPALRLCRTWAAIARAVLLLSPVISTTSSPMLSRVWTASSASGFTVSAMAIIAHRVSTTQSNMLNKRNTCRFRHKITFSNQTIMTNS